MKRTIATSKATIVSWTKFCEWVQGKKVSSERDDEHWTTVMFTDYSCARFFSEDDRKFGETVIVPPIVEIEEAP